MDQHSKILEHGESFVALECSTYSPTSRFTFLDHNMDVLLGGFNLFKKKKKILGGFNFHKIVRFF